MARRGGPLPDAVPALVPDSPDVAPAAARWQSDLMLPFELFTEAAKKALVLAQAEAVRLAGDSSVVLPEHLLLGLMQEKSGVAAEVLAGLGLDPDTVCAAVSGAHAAEPETPLPIGPSTRVRTVFERAFDEARTSRERSVGTQHLLLGLAAEVDGVTAGVFTAAGITTDAIRAEIARVWVESGVEEVSGATREGGEATGAAHAPGAPGRPLPEGLTGEGYTEQARDVLALALEEAERYRHSWIGTEHLLIGLLRDERGVARRVLDALGVDLHRVRRVVEGVLGRTEQLVIETPTMTSRVEKVLMIASEESVRGGRAAIGTEDILLALLMEGEGIAAHVLKDLGAPLEAVRGAIADMRSGGGDILLDEGHRKEARRAAGRYGDDALRVLRAAEMSSGGRLAGAVGPEDLLRALLEEDGFTRRVLQRLGADPDEARRLVTPPGELSSLEADVLRVRSAMQAAIAGRRFERAAVLRERESAALARLVERRRRWLESLE